jgi:hypothetical protein
VSRPLLPGAVVAVVLAVLVAVPVTMALTATHLAGAPVLLVVSTLTAAAAVAGLAAQPWLARRRRLHAAVGGAVVALVAVHLGALVVLEPDDALFAMSPEGPTRARAALLATLALVVVALLGVLRRRIRWRRATYRLLHAGLGALAGTLGVAHATLTDGAFDGVGTVVLLTLGTVGLIGGLRGMITRTSGFREPAVPTGDPGPKQAREGVRTPTTRG